MFLLGIFDDCEDVPISYPYNDTIDTFHTCYERIASSVDGLLDALETRLKISTDTIE